MGGMYTVLVVLLYAVSGSGRFDRTGVSIGALCLLYLLGGLAAGVVLGLFRSALDERHSAFVVAVIAAFPISLGVTVLLSGNLSNWTIEEWSTTAFMSLFIAAIGISVLWKEPG
jgi:hypothetical protein